MARTIGICAHSFEGGALCFLESCRAGTALMGDHMHPSLVMSAIPMGLSMPGWESNDFDAVSVHLNAGIDQLVKAGADFFICPDNTAHLVLERIIGQLPLPGLHIAHVVCNEIVNNGWTHVALLGTEWTMTGSVYEDALRSRELHKLIPGQATRDFIHNAIFDELCMSKFNRKTIDGFIAAIEALKEEGAECVILGCTEIPLIITNENSPLPVLDSTRLLAKGAVDIAVRAQDIPTTGWI